MKYEIKKLLARKIEESRPDLDRLSEMGIEVVSSKKTPKADRSSIYVESTRDGIVSTKKCQTIYRYNPSSHDLHHELRALLRGRRIKKEKVTNVDYEDCVMTWTFEDGSVESYTRDKVGHFMRVDDRFFLKIPRDVAEKIVVLGLA